MEEGEISSEKLAPPKADVIKLEEIVQVQEKGTEDEKVPESVKEEGGEIEEKDGDDEMPVEGDGEEDGKEPELVKEGDGEIGHVGVRQVKDEDHMEMDEQKTVNEEDWEKQEEEGEIKDDSKEVAVDDERMKEEGSEVMDDRDAKKEEAMLKDEEGEIKEESGMQITDNFKTDNEKVEEDEDGEIKDEQERVEDEEGEIKDEPENPENISANLPLQSDNDTDMIAESLTHKQEGITENSACEQEGQDVPINMRGTNYGVPDATETEEGELDDSDEKESEKINAEHSSKLVTEKDEISEIKNSVSRIEFAMDETRPEDEQLDYDEDELEDRMKSGPEPVPPAVPSTDLKSDGEVDSASDGEIKSDDGEGADFEEGETRDHPMDLPPEQKKVCKFFEMGNCTWGDRCRYLHPGVNDKGNYNMFGDSEKRDGRPPPHFHPGPPHVHPPNPFWPEPPPFMPPPIPAAETAWEKGLRHARELKKRALQRKVQEPDFLQKREVLSLNLALNEDHDMEFVNHEPLASKNKGFNPFEEDVDEYATPTPEEVRRALARDRRRPPPPHRHPLDKDRRPPPPEHMAPPDMRRDRRPPSPRHHQGPGRFPMDIRRMSPRRDGDRDRRPNLPPNGPGLIRRDIDRRDRRDYPERPDNRPHFPHDASRRDFPPDRARDEKFDGGKGDKRLQNGAPVGQSQQWSDPWARGRPQAKGRNVKNASSSSSGSSSGSSSRSSSRSSGSSHSTLSGSSRSSSRSSGSSRSSSYSSDRDSSRSPSPSKNPKPKKKVLSSAKQRNAATGTALKKPPPATKPPASKPISQIKNESVVGTVPPKPSPIPSKKPLEKKPNVPAPATGIAKPPVTAKKPAKQKKPESSSSSEFSHSSDSSLSPSRAKAKSGSNTDSGSSSSSSLSSSSGSSSSDSDEGDKPTKRRTGKGTAKPPLGPKGQIPPSASVKPTPLQQQNKGKVMVPSKPGRKDVKMTIIDKPGAPKKRTAAEMMGAQKKPSSRRTELLEQLRAVEDAIARKRAKLP